MDRFTALLDANVIYPAGLRDVLLRLAARNLYRPKWSDAIHDEWMRNVRADRPDLPPEALTRTRAVMDEHFPDARVTGYEPWVDGLDLPDPADRHVVAAAIRGRADVIVTRNLRDFPADRLIAHDLRAEHPDTFATGLFDHNPGAVLLAIREHRAALRQPPRSATEHVAALEQMGLTRLATAVGDFIELI